MLKKIISVLLVGLVLVAPLGTCLAEETANSPWVFITSFNMAVRSVLQEQWAGADAQTLEYLLDAFELSYEPEASEAQGKTIYVMGLKEMGLTIEFDAKDEDAEFSQVMVLCNQDDKSGVVNGARNFMNIFIACFAPYVGLNTDEADKVKEWLNSVEPSETAETYTNDVFVAEYWLDEDTGLVSLQFELV